MREITSPANPQVKAWRQLLTSTGRRAHGLFLAEGDHMAREAVRAGVAECLLVLKEQADKAPELPGAGLQTYMVSPQVLSALSDSKTPQGLLAVCRLPEPPKIGEAGPRLAALNRVQDPGNVGAILRTLDAAGFHGLVIDAGCADPFSPKALRASMGAVFRVPVYAFESLGEALDRLPGYALAAGDLQGSPYYDHPPFGEKVCLLVGNEGAGLEEALLKRADHRLKLPIPGGAESLNAAVAASLMIYDVVLRDRYALVPGNEKE